jgi:hypothetical protein
MRKLSLLFLSLLLTLLLALPGSGGVVFDATSATLPAAGSDDSAVGTLAWTNPGNITASDDTYATADTSSNITYVTHYLKGLTYGFAIPAGATIDGITVIIHRKSSQAGAVRCTKDSRISLVKAGVVETADKADTVTKWPTSEGTASYGGAADLWSGTWTATDINDANFGIVVSATLVQTLDSAVHASVDTITITIDYTPAGTGGGVPRRPIIMSQTRSAKLVGVAQ